MPIVRRSFDQGYFDSWLYGSHPHSRRNRMRLGLVLAHKAEGRLLDIGGGRGDFLELAASRFDVEAIDVSPYAASRLPAELRDRITIGDVESMELPGLSYEVITAFNVLEHLRRPFEVIRKVGNALAAGGIFVGSVPCNAGLIGTLYTAITNYFDRTHISCHKASTWRMAFQSMEALETRLFGEILLDGGLCAYIDNPLWPQLSLNMMFLSRKRPISTGT